MSLEHQFLLLIIKISLRIKAFAPSNIWKVEESKMEKNNIILHKILTQCINLAILKKYLFINLKL